MSYSVSEHLAVTKRFGSTSSTCVTGHSGIVKPAVATTVPASFIVVYRSCAPGLRNASLSEGRQNPDDLANQTPNLALGKPC